MTPAELQQAVAESEQMRPAPIQSPAKTPVQDPAQTAAQVPVQVPAKTPVQAQVQIPNQESSPEPTHELETTPIPTPFPPLPKPTDRHTEIPQERPTERPRTEKHNTYVEKPTITEKVKKLGIDATQPPDTDDGEISIVPNKISAMSGEMPIRQYHVANLRNLLRFTLAAGYIEVTNKRVIFRAEKQNKARNATIHREFDIKHVAGIEGVSSYRFSLPAAAIGLVTIVAFAALMAWLVLSFTHGFARDLLSLDTATHMSMPALWLIIPRAIEGLTQGRQPDVNSISMIVGLVAGFGGIALFFVLRGKFWFKQMLLGISLGGFGVVALTYNTFAFVLLAVSVVMTIVGLVIFSWMPDLTINVRSMEGQEICLIRRRSLSLLAGAPTARYAESAPREDTEAALSEIGAVIGDIRVLGRAGVDRWLE